MNILYKGFDENLKCRDFQFEIGKTYFHDGLVRVCESGFHACENPWDVLRYYPLTDSRYCVVEQSGEIHRHDGDSKIASSSITISTELKLPEFVKTCVNWLIKACSADAEVASGNHSRLAALGEYSRLAASGNYSRLAASGNGSLVMGAYSSRAKAGPNGAIALAWHDGTRPRIAVGYVGEGLEADTWYRLDDNGAFVADSGKEAI